MENKDDKDNWIEKMPEAPLYKMDEVPPEHRREVKEVKGIWQQMQESAHIIQVDEHGYIMPRKPMMLIDIITEYGIEHRKQYAKQEQQTNQEEQGTAE